MNRADAADVTSLAATVLRRLTATPTPPDHHRHPGAALDVIERAAPGVLDDPALAAAMLVELSELAAEALRVAARESGTSAWHAAGQVEDARRAALLMDAW